MDRVRKCGQVPHAAEGVSIRTRSDYAYYEGLTTCGSIWACPPCSARIRQRRGREIEFASLKHLDAGGGIGLGTFTLSHQRSDDLKELLGRVQLAWAKVRRNNAVVRAFERYGITGRIRATEITYGYWHGFHPHLHMLFFAERALSDQEWAQLRDILEAAWITAVASLGGKALRQDRTGQNVAVTLGAVQKAAVGQYIAKVQDHYGQASSVSKEMARGDLKQGRKTSRTPFEVAEGAVAGVAPDVHVWWAYEDATKGRRAIEWSRGLKARYGVQELSDEELAAAETDGERLALIPVTEWVLVVRAGKETHLLDLAEDGGGTAVHDFLAQLTRQAERARL